MNPDARMRFHMDIESICGGTTFDLWQAWRRTYGLDSGPTDFIISLGLNDVEIKTPTAFMNPLHAWNVEDISNNPTSTFRLCRLMRPPKLAWFERNGAYPTTGNVNHIDKINEINALIDSFNLQKGHTHVPWVPVGGLQSRGQHQKRGGSGDQVHDQAPDVGLAGVRAGTGALPPLGRERKGRALLEGGKVPGLEGTQGRQQQQQLALNG